MLSHLPGMEVSEPFRLVAVDKLQKHLRRGPKWRMNLEQCHKYFQSNPVAVELSLRCVNTSELWTVLESLHFASDLIQRAVNIKDRQVHFEECLKTAATANRNKREYQKFSLRSQSKNKKTVISVGKATKPDRDKRFELIGWEVGASFSSPIKHTIDLNQCRVV